MSGSLIVVIVDLFAIRAIKFLVACPVAKGTGPSTLKTIVRMTAAVVSRIKDAC